MLATFPRASKTEQKPCNLIRSAGWIWIHAMDTGTQEDSRFRQKDLVPNYLRYARKMIWLWRDLTQVISILN